MYFYKKLYVSPQIADPEEVRRKLLRGAGMLDIYVITLIPDPQRRGGDQMELYHCANLHQPYYREHPPLILGLAKGRGDAIAVVQQILEEAVSATGRADVHGYLFPGGVRLGGGKGGT